MWWFDNFHYTVPRVLDINSDFLYTQLHINNNDIFRCCKSGIISFCYSIIYGVHIYYIIIFYMDVYFLNKSNIFLYMLIVSCIIAQLLFSDSQGLQSRYPNRHNSSLISVGFKHTMLVFSHGLLRKAWIVLPL